jgi:hypothetical protein
MKYVEKEIEINGEKYILASTVKAKREDVSKDKYVIVRTYSAGVFAGFLKERKGKEVVLRDARRIWYWEGAYTLSDLAMVGTTKPTSCKFPAPVDEVILTEAIEILAVTAKAKTSIESVPAWVK